MKIGLWLGLGFAFAENTLYFFTFFSDAYSVHVLVLTLFIRGILSTLAHGLYGTIMGYYLSLAKFHALYRPRFLRISLATSTLVHGFFNFLLIVYLGTASVFLLMAFLAIALIWYADRRSLEVNASSSDLLNMKRPPFLAIQHELEVVLSKQNAPFSSFQKLLTWFP